jgi:hypothetical protein
MLFNIKLYTYNTFNVYFSKRHENEFILKKVELYINLKEKYDVTKYFYKNKNKINIIDRDLIKNIYDANSFNFDYNLDIRLKILFIYNQRNYIIYFPYDKLMNKDINDYYIPYPFFNKNIIEQYRKDIILPYHSKDNKKKLLYSLFNIESKDISSIEINGVKNNLLLEYFYMIQTPFNDFGILYNVPIKLLWILNENNIDINEFQEFKLTYLNMYFDEEEMDLKDHYILIDSKSLDKTIISKRMEKILIEKELL